MTKDQVLFFMNRLRRFTELPSQKEMADRGADYEARRLIEEQRELFAKEREAMNKAIDILGDIPDHDPVWGE
jgi:hypothetical protein